jgi:hypothetical protein
LQRRTAKGHVYYACRTYTEKSREKCSKHTVAEVDLKELILAVLRLQIGLAELDHKVINVMGGEEGANGDLFKYLGKRIAEQKKELCKIEELSDGLYIDWKSGEITKDEYRRMKVRFDEQILRIQTVITNLEEEKQQTVQADRNKSAAFEEIQHHKNITKLDRSILTELTEMIYVYEKRKIAVWFNYKDIQVEHISTKPRYDTEALIH